ncbi:hypothetical protein [Nocardia noduli]|uniref:hypothetical protein n=1 Tax=Nocardia noduli TaxID=2815722 RepID=UPI0020B39D84|nr:hypothetical protein [Nocardia noduli]
MGAETREVLAAAQLAEVAENPDRLTAMRDATPPLAELARRSAEARAHRPPRRSPRGPP